MEGLEETARAVAQQSARALPFEPVFEALEPVESGPCVAVDGSSAVLVDNGSVWVVAIRATALAWPGPALPLPPRLVAASPEEAQEQVDAQYAGHGLEAPRMASAEAFAEALMALEEWQHAKQALATSADALVLVDGALERLPRHAQPMADRLLEAARGDLIGVSKRSRLERDGVPLVHALRRVAPAGRWSVRVPGYSQTQVVRLHPAGPAFRVDGRAEAVARLPALCNDAVYLGYPYPLAAAHNQVALTGSEVAGVREALVDAVRQAGGPAADEMLADFHDVLDRNVPR